MKSAPLYSGITAAIIICIQGLSGRGRLSGSVNRALIGRTSFFAARRPSGVQGLPGPETAISIADDPGGLANAAVKLLLDDAALREASVRQVQYAPQHFSRDAFQRSFLEAIGDWKSLAALGPVESTLNSLYLDLCRSSVPSSFSRSGRGALGGVHSRAERTAFRRQRRASRAELLAKSPKVRAADHRFPSTKGAISKPYVEFSFRPLTIERRTLPKLQRADSFSVPICVFGFDAILVS